ncbi:hypothetical protein ALC56_01908 [Trachymyrmex septentrionalis]|uniref:Uncharacterized protein n=1 Tax=Trachymyrmex septentrionalis TaxID=34720 RepID=A0A195FT94_9HYME|nr:hypothetical protein ALC56_01908 [Trachymyrmex septentrionalis]
MIAQKNYQRRDEVLLVVIFVEESDCLLSRNFIGGEELVEGNGDPPKLYM